MTTTYKPTPLADDFSDTLSVNTLLLFNDISNYPKYQSLTDADLMYALFKTCSRYVASTIKQAGELDTGSDLSSVINMDALIKMVNDSKHNMDTATEEVKQRAESMLNDLGIS